MALVARLLPDAAATRASATERNVGEAFDAQRFYERDRFSG